MKVSIDRDIDRSEVLRLLESFPKATFFHAPAWLEILTNSFPAFTAGWITARAGSDLVGLMPFIEVERGPFKTLWALPFGAYGDPIAHERAIAHSLLDAFFGLARRRSCLEAGANLFFTEEPFELPSDVIRRSEECRFIDLEGTFEDYRSRLLSRKRRQLCNRALDAGVEVRPIEDRNGLKEMYEAYLIDSRSWGGVHPYPFAFFEELFAHRRDGVVVLGGYLGDEFLGGHVDFYFGGIAQAWQAALTARAATFEISALIVLKAVEEAYRRGMKVFNLGSSGGNEGIVFFKESLGGREHLYAVLESRKRWFRILKRR